jgi:hypothetical protein
LTFQKRGRGTIVRQKPIPKDPKSEAQLARRQIYRDAVALWNSLTLQEKEAWRGICPGLTPYQCFMSEELKYVPPPPPIPIDIGSPAIDRATWTVAGYTFIDKNNPADGTGIIKTIEVWPQIELTGCIIATFYIINANTLKTRDSEAIPGTIPAGSKQTYPVTIAVVEGDYIGYFSPSGRTERDTEGFAGIWGASGDKTPPETEAAYSFYNGDAVSLYGKGEAE